MFVSRDVIFREDVFPFHYVISDAHFTDPFPGLVLPHPLQDPTISPATKSSSSNDPSTSSISLPPPILDSIPARRSSRATKPPSYLQDYHLAFSKTPIFHHRFSSISLIIGSLL